MRRVGIISLSIAASSLASCGGDGRSSQLSSGTEGHLETACPNDAPDACIEPAPSYQNDVAPLLDRYCHSCHSPGGAAPDHVFDTYAVVKAQGKNDVFTQVYQCRMPPVILPQPTPAERLKILDWFVCGAPNN